MSSTEVSPRELDTQRIMGEALPEIESTTEVQRAFVERILAADTLEEVFREDSTIATRELIGRPIEIRACRIMRSSLEGSKGVYMLLDATLLDDDEAIVVNTGAPNVMAAVFRAKQLGQLPIEVEVIEVARAREGRSAPLGLRPYGKTLEKLDARKRTK